MKITMLLLSDTIFGNGMSIPGGEDISILRDGQGFPYYKGSSFKGIFREELRNLLLAKGYDEDDVYTTSMELLGRSGDDRPSAGKLTFSDLTIPDPVKKEIYNEKDVSSDEVFRAMTHIRTFTKLDDKDGIASEGSLRVARCVNKGVCFEGEINCTKEHEELIRELLSWIKWIGTMRNRGFGKVRFSWEEA